MIILCVIHIYVYDSISSRYQHVGDSARTVTFNVEHQILFYDTIHTLFAFQAEEEN